MIGHCAATEASGNSGSPEWQRCSDNNQAGGLVQDNGFKRGKSKQTDQERQTKLCTAKADQAAKRTNASSNCKCTKATPLNHGTAMPWRDPECQPFSGSGWSAYNRYWAAGSMLDEATAPIKRYRRHARQ